MSVEYDEDDETVAGSAVSVTTEGDDCHWTKHLLVPAKTVTEWEPAFPWPRIVSRTEAWVCANCGMEVRRD